MVTMTSIPSSPRRAPASKASAVRSGKTEAVDSATDTPAAGATWPTAPPSFSPPFFPPGAAFEHGIRGILPGQLMPTPGEVPPHGRVSRWAVGTGGYGASHGKVCRCGGALPVLGVRLAEHEVGRAVRRVPG